MTSTLTLKWDINHIKKYGWLFNKLKVEHPNIKKDSYIHDIDKNTLLNFIKKSSLGISSKESLYFIVARWLEINEPNNNMISAFKQAGYNLKVQYESADMDNKLDDKEQQNYKEYSYFKTILDKINFDKITNKRQHYESLLLALLVYQPPMRTSFYTSCLITTNPAVNTVDNYIVLTHTKSIIRRAYFYINKDKVSGSKSYADTSKKIIEIENKTLIDILFNSYDTYNRKYLLENNNKQIVYSALLRYLRNITNIPAINIDMMRSMYITNEYNKGLSYKQKEVLSLKMRHSVDIASKAYYKISDKAKPRDEEIDILKTENNRLQVELLGLKAQLNIHNPTDKLMHKRRTDVLFRLNKGDASKSATLDKYDIKYNEDTKKYF